ncbi:MAG TPA: GDSL-type esterase/lipase family protein [Thermoanaerobaculia bacterium]|nr:GDSL-type esterase/lipase family protein [Thermoanaerobaculia bacterium]
MGLAEILVRTFWPQPAFYASPGLYVLDPKVGHRMKPGLKGVLGNFAEFTTQVRVNQLGIRGPEVGPLRPGVRRVLVLGDSFSFGMGVEEQDAFPAQLAAELGRRGVPAEGINAGIGGYGVPDEVRWFEQYGREIHPDVIVLGIFTGNDLQDAAPDRPPAFVSHGELLDKAELKRSALFHWLYQHSQLFALVKYSLPAPIDRTIRRTLHMPEPSAIRGLREEMALYDPRNRPRAEQGGRTSEAAIRRLLDLAGADHSVVVALLLPSKLQADDVEWNGALRQLGLTPSQVDRTLPNEIFSGVLARCGVPALDLTPILSEALRRGEVDFFPRDQHYTVAGNRRIAREAASFLRGRVERLNLVRPPGYTHPPPAPEAGLPKAP